MDDFSGNVDNNVDDSGEAFPANAINYMDAFVIGFVFLRNLASSVERLMDMCVSATAMHSNMIRENQKFAREGSRDIERLISGNE